MKARLAAGQLRLGLGNIGHRDLPGIEALTRVFEHALQHAKIVLLDFEVGAVARYVHVDRGGREQDRLLHDAQRLACRRNLTFCRPDLVSGLAAVEQRLRSGRAVGGRLSVALDRHRCALRQRGAGDRRKKELLITILVAVAGIGGDGRAIARQRLRHAFVALADHGALRVELRIVLIGPRQRRFDGLGGGFVRGGGNDRAY